jgi:hypothetical protein
MKKGHHMLVTAALAAIMMMGISNMYGKALEVGWIWFSLRQ